MPSSQKTFRVFVSSTFTDMGAERRILQEEVFRDLKKYCQARGASFQAVDLRWGVNEASQLEQRTMDICLSEIARCQRLSPRPNFIVLLGDRYGWQPIPNKIPSSEMAELQTHLIGEGAKLISNWYQEDTNAIPPEYVLNPRGDKYRDYEKWRPVEDSLRAALREAVDKIDFSAEQRIKYVASATHQEIINGALKTPVTGIDPADHVFAYLREMDPPPHGDKAGDYLDFLPDGTLDPHARAQMDGLKEELAGNPPKVGGKLPKDHIYKYKAQWHGGAQFHEGVLKDFADQVRKDLVKVIDQELEKITAPDALTREKQLQADSAQRLTRFFTGQEEPRRNIAAYIEKGSGKPFALIGPSGSGKSSLMARAMEEAARGFSGVMVYRFIGATSTSSNPLLMLRQVCEEIAGAYHTSLPSLLKEGENDQKLGTYAGLSEIFSRCLHLATEDMSLVIFLDALDQLQSGRFDFLPITPPEHVRIVVSALPELEDRLAFAEVHRLPLMPEQDGEELLGKWLASEARILTDSQRQEVIGKFSKNGLPLYLKLAFEQARMWHSYDVGKVLPADVAGILARYFDLLEKEHTAVLVRKVTGYLMCGKYQGLTEAEILDILVFDPEYWESFVQGSHPANRAEILKLKKLPIVVWSRLFLDLEPYLTERDADGIPIITFYHRQFLEYAGERYLSSSPPLGPRRANGDLEEDAAASPLGQRGGRGDLDLAAKFHATLAGYFETLPLSLDAPEQSPNVSKMIEQPNYRKISELPYQWSISKEFAHLADCLTDATFIRESCLAYGPNDLVVFAEEVVTYLNRENDLYKKTVVVREALKKFQPLLNQEPSCLLQQVILTSAESTLDPEIEAWKEQLKIHVPTPWVFTSISGPLAPKSPLYRDLGLQKDWVPALATDSGFQYLYTLNMSGNFRRYNIQTGIMEIDGQAKEKKTIQALTFALFQPNKALLGYADGRVFEWVDGDRKCVFHPPDPYTVNAIEIIPKMKLILIAPGQFINRSTGTLFVLDSWDYHIVSKAELDDRLVFLNEALDEKKKIINQHGVQVNRMMASHNSNEIAFAFHHGEVSLFNLETGIWRRIFFLPEKAVYDLVFDQMGNILFFGGGDEKQGFLLAFDLLTWSNCASRVLPTGVTAMTMAGKNKHLIIGDWDGNISFLHPQTLETEQCFSSDVYGCVRCLVSDPAAQFFAASGRGVRIFTLNTSLPPRKLGMVDWTWHALQAHAGPEQGLGLAWNMRLGLRAVSLVTGEILASNDSIKNARCAAQTPIAIASSLQAVYTISLPGLEILDSLEIGVHGVVHGIAINSKGTRGACLVTKGGKTYLCDLNINPSSGTVTIADRIILDSHPGLSIPTAISEDGSFIVAVASQSHKLTKKTEGSLAKEIENQPVKLVIWNVRTRQTKTIVIKTLVGALALSSDSSMMCLAPGPQFEFVGAIDDFNINRFETRNHSLDEKATIPTPSISLWDLRNGTKLADFGHVDDIISLDITRDGKHIASLSDDGTLRIWDVVSGKNLAMIGFEGRPLWCGFSDSKREILVLFRGWRADLRVIPRRLLIEE